MDLLPLLDLTEEEFQKRFRGTAIMRAKREGLQRNACVALGNLGDPVAVPALAKALCQGVSLVRGHAAWALGRLAGPQAGEALREVVSPREGPMGAGGDSASAGRTASEVLDRLGQKAQSIKVG